MSELTKGEKERIVIDVLHDFNNIEVGTNLQKMAEKILDAIEPPEIVPGMWGKFWDDERIDQCVYGEFTEMAIDPIGDGKNYFQAPNGISEHFLPISGLKEAIEKLE